jgi:hypothetical protein
VLAAGGINLSGAISNGADSAELYGPASGTWSISGSLGMARANNTATLLLNGTVLTAGGFFASFTLSSAELYNAAPAGVLSGIFELLLLE